MVMWLFGLAVVALGSLRTPVYNIIFDDIELSDAEPVTFVENLNGMAANLSQQVSLLSTDDKLVTSFSNNMKDLSSNLATLQKLSTSSPETPCTSDEDCKDIQTGIEACTNQRIGAMKAYNEVNRGIMVMGKAVSQLCGCMYAQDVSICALKNIAPVCLVPYQAYTGIFRANVKLWDAVKASTKMCAVVGSPDLTSQSFLSETSEPTVRVEVPLESDPATPFVKKLKRRVAEAETNLQVFQADMQTTDVLKAAGSFLERILPEDPLALANPDAEQASEPTVVTIHYDVPNEVRRPSFLQRAGHREDPEVDVAKTLDDLSKTVKSDSTEVSQALEEASASLVEKLHASGRNRQLNQAAFKLVSKALKTYLFAGGCERDLNGPPKARGSGCGEFELHNANPEEKLQMSYVCAYEWACKDSCLRDYSRPCPVGWTPSAETCIAPSSYATHADCPGAVSLLELDNTERALWAAKCGVTWPCRKGDDGAVSFLEQTDIAEEVLKLLPSLTAPSTTEKGLESLLNLLANPSAAADMRNAGLVPVLNNILSGKMPASEGARLKAGSLVTHLTNLPVSASLVDSEGGGSETLIVLPSSRRVHETDVRRMRLDALESDN